MVAPGRPGPGASDSPSGVSPAATEDPTAARFAWEGLRSAHLLAGEYEASVQCRGEAMALARQAGDRVHEAHDLVAGALALGYLGRITEADAELARADALLAVDENPSTRAFLEYVAGEIRVETAPAEALPSPRAQSRPCSSQAGNRFITGIAGVSALSCRGPSRRGRTALAGFGELLDIFHRSGSWPQLWTTVRRLVETLVQLERYEEAAVILGVVEGGGTRPVVRGADLPRLERTRAALVTALGADRVTALLARRRSAR